ncbi:MAG: FKBP-type peptidyl-prolyl cis-trans isomerase [Prevotellaceae bacterium]|jgi:FKBP-type peptidyl-prolyl cis-trans isomerase|nr:FKBP-type peptidyl-prolyl cis-trans isomerase [Prevotellaceae bacterium]
MKPTYFKRYFIIAVVTLILSVLSACRKNAPPQLPSNKGNVPDSTAYFFTKVNGAAIAQEDSVLTEFVRRNYTDFTKSPEGFWYKVFPAHKGDKLKRSDMPKVRCQLYTLDNHLLQSESFTASFGKKEMTTGLESGLLLLSYGDSAVLVVPYYLAFGMKGDSRKIPPYTSVIYRLAVEK